MVCSMRPLRQRLLVAIRAASLALLKVQVVVETLAVAVLRAGIDLPYRLRRKVGKALLQWRFAVSP